VAIVDRMAENEQSQTKKRWKLVRFLIVLLLSVLLIVAIVLLASESNSVAPGYKADVALYVGGRYMHSSGLVTWDSGVTATLNMLRWINVTVRIVTAYDINSNQLNGSRVLYVPGGDMYQYSLEISAEGRENIRSFVRNGGGYIGVCEGAFFACDSYRWADPKHRCMKATLGLLAGTAFGPVDAIIHYPNYSMCKISIVNKAHVITESEPEVHWMLYDGGPAFAPQPAARATLLANYSEGNKPAILAFENHQGRVFLIGAHPEFEEDSEQDGVTFENEFDDNGSEWILMKKAVLWCMRE